MPEPRKEDDRSARMGELSRLEASLEEVRRVAEHASTLTASQLEAELQEAMAVIREGFVPREETEERLAGAIGGPQLAGITSVGHRELDRRLTALEGALRRLHSAPDVEDPVDGRRLAADLTALEALAANQLAIERWLLANRPVGRASRGSSLSAIEPGTHCEWCGAEYPEPETQHAAS
jgi:hypothetical protein